MLSVTFLPALLAVSPSRWRAAGLPSTDTGGLDLEFQGREMEAVTCARIRLLAAAGRPNGAAALQRALARTAAEHDLKRTLMRALALRVRLRALSE